MQKVLTGNKRVIVYGIALALLLFLLKWLELRLIIFDHSQELFTGGIAILFTALGIWLALKLSTPKIQKVFVEREPNSTPRPFVFDQREADRIG